MLKERCNSELPRNKNVIQIESDSFLIQFLTLFFLFGYVFCRAKTVTASSSKTHISHFFQNTTEQTPSPDPPNSNGIVKNLRKRKSYTGLNESLTEETSNRDDPVELQNENIEVEQSPREEFSNTKPRSFNSHKIPKTDASQTAKSEVITSFFSSEKDESLEDFQEVVKPVPKLKPNSNATAKKKPTLQKKKQPDIRKCLQKPCTDETFNQLLSDHCVLDNIDPDQLQLALAMSKSLEDNKICGIPATTEEMSEKENEAIVKGIATVRKTIEKFSFKSKHRNTGVLESDFAEFFGINRQSRSKGSKWKSRCTPLTRRKHDLQQEKIKKNVDEFLLMNVTNNFRPAASPDVEPYELISKKLQRALIPEGILFWANAVETDSLRNIHMYYTNNLVSPTKTKCGALLRDWASIPGRDEVFDCIPMSLRNTANLPEDLDSQASPEALWEPSPTTAEPSTSQSTSEVEGTEESQLTVEDSDKTILLENDDIERELNIINTQIQTTKELLDSSSEMVEMNRMASGTSHVRREPSPDMFADCDIDDDVPDFSTDSQSSTFAQYDSE